MNSSQIAADVLLGVIGVISALGLLGVVAAFWSLSRSAYRKD